MDEGPEASEEYYKKWVETVKAVVPNDRLLVFDVKQVCIYDSYETKGRDI